MPEELSNTQSIFGCPGYLERAEGVNDAGDVDETIFHLRMGTVSETIKSIIKMREELLMSHQSPRRLEGQMNTKRIVRYRRNRLMPAMQEIS
jgi:hypothetical protein